MFSVPDDKVSLIHTRRDEEGERLVEDLRRRVAAANQSVCETQLIITKGGVPPEVVYFACSALTWIGGGLLFLAGVYVSEWVKCYAKEHVENRKDIIRKAKKLATAASGFVSFEEIISILKRLRRGETLTLVLKTESCEIYIQLSDDEDIAFDEMARAIAMIEDISAAVRHHYPMATTQMPAIVKMTASGCEISYQHSHDRPTGVTLQTQAKRSMNRTARLRHDLPMTGRIL